MTKTIVAAAALAVFASAASAADLGNGFTLGGEATAEYTWDAERFAVDVEPKIGYLAPYGIHLEASTVVSVYDDEFTIQDQFDTLPVVDFRAEKGIEGFTLYGEISYDLEAKERSEIATGVTFEF